MDFEPTEEHKAFRDRVRRFAEAEIRPKAGDVDAGRADPRALIRALGQQKMMGVAAPEEDGGCGLDPVSYVLALMEVSRQKLPRERTAYKELRKAKRRHFTNISTKTELKTIAKKFQKLIDTKKPLPKGQS